MITISELKIIGGKIPKRAFIMVLEWAFQYREELIENWERAQKNQPLRKIPPLK